MLASAAGGTPDVAKGTTPSTQMTCLGKQQSAFAAMRGSDCYTPNNPGVWGPAKNGEKGNAMADDDVKAELERLRRENAALKKGASESIRMKVSEKGAVSVYGMGRFPVTLYKEQWLRLLNMSDEIRAFIAENESRLKAKE
jgi:hypothetical protein